MPAIAVATRRTIEILFAGKAPWIDRRVLVDEDEAREELYERYGADCDEDGQPWSDAVLYDAAVRVAQRDGRWCNSSKRGQPGRAVEGQPAPTKQTKAGGAKCQ